LLARLFSPPSDHEAAPSQGIFGSSSADVWRLGQQRRTQYLAALLNRQRVLPQRVGRHAGDPHAQTAR
jgi:hypothetical protein